jgi:hypothetical protein
LRPPRPANDTDRLFAELLRAGERLPEIRAFLSAREPDETQLLELLRRPVPTLLLEHLGTTPPWSERPRLLGRVVANPKTRRALALRLLPNLFWRDLADVAASPRLPFAVRSRAESILKEMLIDLRLGERVTLAKLATPGVLVALLADQEPRVTRALLTNPRLREQDLLIAIRSESASRALLEETASCYRWRDAYNVRMELVLQPRTPLGVALGQLSSLRRRDLTRIAETKALRPLLKAAALRVARGDGKP